MGMRDLGSLKAFIVEKANFEGLTAGDAVVQARDTCPLASVQYLSLALASATSALKLEWNGSRDSHLLGSGPIDFRLLA